MQRAKGKLKDTLTKEELSRLYISKNKTDKQIAEMYSVGQDAVFQLRKKYEIKGIITRDRRHKENPQLPMTSRQKEIILGSLLGDCCLKGNTSSSGNAHISIAHSIKQKEYLDWIYLELKSISPTSPVSYLSKKGYTTISFASETRSDIGEIRRKIYTPHKTVSSWWLDQVGALGVAVWYMDDGCLNFVNKSRSVFSFATNLFSEAENYLLSGMLKDKFSIYSEVKPINRKSGLQYNLVISDRSFEAFDELISPYIVKSMKYKIPCSQAIEKLKKNIKSPVNKEILNNLYHKELLTQEQIAKVFGVHKVTIRKYMSIFDIKSRDIVSAQLNGKNNRCKRSRLGRFKELNLDAKGEEKAKELYEKFRSGGFPYLKIKDDKHYLGILDRTCSAVLLPDDRGVVRYSRMGVNICSEHCPQIFSMAAHNSLSPLEIFQDNDMLMDCVRRTIKFAKKETLASVRNGLKTYRKNRCVTIFPPLWCKAIIDKYCEGKTGLSLLDFSSGFGGRLIGSYASGIVSEYYGIDPLKSNIDSCYAINKLLTQHSNLIGREFNPVLINDTAENAINKIGRKFDLVLTCPPYFNKEKYANNSSQCYVRYPKYEEWIDKWLNKVLSDAYSSLKDNGYMIMFLSDYGKLKVGDACRDIMHQLSGQTPECIKFSVINIEYNRSSSSKKYDTAWIVKK